MMFLFDMGETLKGIIRQTLGIKIKNTHAKKMGQIEIINDHHLGGLAAIAHFGAIKFGILKEIRTRKDTETDKLLSDYLVEVKIADENALATIHVRDPEAIKIVTDWFWSKDQLRDLMLVASKQCLPWVAGAGKIFQERMDKLKADAEELSK